MKTKYSQLLKIKKQNVDSIENEIAFLNSKKLSIENAINELASEIRSIDKPRKGNFGKFLTVSYSFDSLFSLKKEKKITLQKIEYKLIKKKEEYKTALMEYEKIKYLEELSIEQKLDKIKKDEQKLLDELSMMTYKRRTF